MRYNFRDIQNAEIYENTKVMFVLGKYVWFNNMVCDTLKGISFDIGDDETYSVAPVIDTTLSDEFGVERSDDSALSNSVDFSTFMEVIGVANINGKWYCRTDLSMLNKKQKDQLLKYIKEPSDNGILVITSNDWMQYKELLKNRVIGISKDVHLIQLSFPSKPILKSIIAQWFDERGVQIEGSAADLFIMKMSTAYEEYEEQLNNIMSMHKETVLNAKDIRTYMRGIEHFVVDNFIEELVKPLSNDKVNNKKIFKMLATLEDEIGAKNLLYQTLKIVDEAIEYRLLINDGYIPIGINYFFKDIIDGLPDKEKYEKTTEWKFRKKVILASQTSLRDWYYMKLILTKAIENPRISDKELDIRCQKALYEVCTRSVLNKSRIDNIIGISNVLNIDFDNLDSIIFDEEALNKLQEEIMLANIS